MITAMVNHKVGLDPTIEPDVGSVVVTVRKHNIGVLIPWRRFVDGWRRPGFNQTWTWAEIIDGRRVIGIFEEI